MVVVNNTECNNPLVSIIVVTYNSSNFVLEALESAKDQSYKKVELIVTDDCSTDNTREICKKWIEQNEQRFVRVTLITSEKNTGIPANCNRGIKTCKGEWLIFIAGDDVLLENCIHDNLSFVKENPNAKFISSKVKNINEVGELLNTKRSLFDAFIKFYFNQSAIKQLKIYSRRPVFLNSPTFFIKRELIVAVDYFDEMFKIHEDMCLIYRVNGINEKVFFLDKNTVKYRIHENAISRNMKSSLETRRNEEKFLVFNKYRKKHLSILNLIDLSIYYDTWLELRYKGFFGLKGVRILKKLSLFYWYLIYLNIIKR